MTLSASCGSRVDLVRARVWVVFGNFRGRVWICERIVCPLLRGFRNGVIGTGPIWYSGGHEANH